MGMRSLCRAGLLVLSLLALGRPLPAAAGIKDCLKTALNAANPDDLRKAAAFASAHPQCLAKFVPPTLVPYVALSGSLDAANQSGVLDRVGLGFGRSYAQCTANFDPGRVTARQLAPVLQPVCGTLGLDCGMFDGPAADGVNAQLAEQAPVLDLLPCACAAATSGLGAERLVEVLETGQACGATIAELATDLGNTATDIAESGGRVLDTATGIAADTVEAIGCTFFHCEKQANLPPLSADAFYHLYFEPTYALLLKSKFEDDPGFGALLASVESSGKAYYSHYDTDFGAVTQNNMRLESAIAGLHEAIQRKADLYYTLHVLPEVQDWARMQFGQDPAPWVEAHVAACRADVHTAFPLPSPTQRCEEAEAAIANAVASHGHFLAEGSLRKQAAQCRAEQQVYVIQPEDAIAIAACDGVARKTSVAAVGAMAAWKRRMDKAAQAGCTNDGTPDGIRCPGFEAFVACRKSLTDSSALCGDAGTQLAQGVLEKLHAESKAAGKPQRCLRLQQEVQCSRPRKQEACKTYMQLLGSQVGLQGVQAQCSLVEDPQYRQQRQLATQVVALLNGGPVRPKIRPVGSAPPANNVALAPITPGVAQGLRKAAAGQCRVEAPDWLRIRCPSGFQWDADPARREAIIGVLGSPLPLCPDDPEADGADLPCLAGAQVGAFPEPARPAH